MVDYKNPLIPSNNDFLERDSKGISKATKQGTVLLLSSVTGLLITLLLPWKSDFHNNNHIFYSDLNKEFGSYFSNSAKMILFGCFIGIIISIIMLSLEITFKPFHVGRFPLPNLIASCVLLIPSLMITLPSLRFIGIWFSGILNNKPETVMVSPMILFFIGLIFFSVSITPIWALIKITQKMDKIGIFTQILHLIVIISFIGLISIPLLPWLVLENDGINIYLVESEIKMLENSENIELLVNYFNFLTLGLILVLITGSISTIGIVLNLSGKKHLSNYVIAIGCIAFVGSFLILVLNILIFRELNGIEKDFQSLGIAENVNYAWNYVPLFSSFFLLGLSIFYTILAVLYLKPLQVEGGILKYIEPNSIFPFVELKEAVEYKTNLNEKIIENANINDDEEILDERILISEDRLNEDLKNKIEFIEKGKEDFINCHDCGEVINIKTYDKPLTVVCSNCLKRYRVIN